MGRTHMTTELGKIIDVRVGLTGRDDNALGVHFTLGARDGWRVQDTWLFDSDERRHDFENMLVLAEVTDAADLIDKPVRATFEGNALKEWRLLTECL